MVTKNSSFLLIIIVIAEKLGRISTKNVLAVKKQNEGVLAPEGV
jgi:hypothetical protein